MACKIELIFIPVTDVDRAIDFYVEKVGFTLDMQARATPVVLESPDAPAEEQWAADTIEAALGVVMRHQDNAPRPGMSDMDIFRPGVRREPLR